MGYTTLGRSITVNSIVTTAITVCVCVYIQNVYLTLRPHPLGIVPPHTLQTDKLNALMETCIPLGLLVLRMDSAARVHHVSQLWVRCVCTASEIQ